MKRNGIELAPEINDRIGHEDPGSGASFTRALNIWLIRNGQPTRGYGEFSGRIARECIADRARRRTRLREATARQEEATR